MKKTILIFSLLAWACMETIFAQVSDDTNYLGKIDKAFSLEYAEVRMEVYKNDKLLKYYSMEFYRRGEKMRMEFLEPATEKGRRMLNDESNLWMYMPRTSKVMKLPLKQAFMGSDASNRDLMRMAFQKDYEIISIQPDGENQLLLELKAKDGSISYHKMVVRFDTVRQLPLHQEMYSISGKLIKTMEYTYEKQADGSWVCHTVVIRDELLKNSLTKMYYRGVKRKNDKPDVFFTLGSLRQ